MVERQVLIPMLVVKIRVCFRQPAATVMKYKTILTNVLVQSIAPSTVAAVFRPLLPIRSVFFHIPDIPGLWFINAIYGRGARQV